MSEQDIKAESQAETVDEEMENSETTPQGEQPDYQAKAKAFYAQLKEEKAKRKELEEKVAKLTPKEEPKKEEPKQEADIPVREVLALRAEGYSEGEILTLHQYSVSMRKPINEVAKDPFIKGGIDALREKAKNDAAIPTPSNRVPVINGKTVEQLNDAEFKGNYDKLVAAALAKKRAK